MSDSELRGIVLRKLYDSRRQGMVPLPVELSSSVLTPDTVFEICRQLAEKGLIRWKPIEGQGGGGYLRTGMAQITAFGIDVIEGNATSPISVSIDRSVTISSSSNVQVGEGNFQNVRFSAEKIALAIDQANASVLEKEKAKSLLKSFLENPIISTIISNWIPK